MTGRSQETLHISTHIELLLISTIAVSLVNLNHSTVNMKLREIKIRIKTRLHCGLLCYDSGFGFELTFDPRNA